MKGLKRVMVILTLLVILAGAEGYIFGCNYFKDHFRMGTTIDGISCSFKSIDEVAEIYQKKADAYAMAVNTRNGGVEEMDAGELGLHFAKRQTLENICEDQGCYAWFMPDNKEYHVSEPYGIDEGALAEGISGLKCVSGMTIGSQAHIVKTGDIYQVAAAVHGTEVNVEMATDVIKGAALGFEPEVDLEAAGCYIDKEAVDENGLQRQCDILNSIHDMVITYDFGDRKETITYDTVIDELVGNDYMFDMDKTKAYVSKIAEKYDTAGTDRTFVTYDGSTAKVEGGDYGWVLDVDKTAEALLRQVKKGAVSVMQPIYTQKAVSRLKNDIGYSYLEIDLGHKKAVLYIDGVPVVETGCRASGDTETGCYRVKSITEFTESGGKYAIIFNGSMVYQYVPGSAQKHSGVDDISEFIDSGILAGCVGIEGDDMIEIFRKMDSTWPIVIYGKDDIVAEGEEQREEN